MKEFKLAKAKNYFEIQSNKIYVHLNIQNILCYFCFKNSYPWIKMTWEGDPANKKS